MPVLGARPDPQPTAMARIVDERRIVRKLSSSQSLGPAPLIVPQIAALTWPHCVRRLLYFLYSRPQPVLSEGVPTLEGRFTIAGEFSNDPIAKNGFKSKCTLSDSICRTLPLWEPSSGSIALRLGSGSRLDHVYHGFLPCVSAIQCSGANILATGSIFLCPLACCRGHSDSKRGRRSSTLMGMAFRHLVCVLVCAHVHGAVLGFGFRAQTLRPT